MTQWSRELVGAVIEIEWTGQAVFRMEPASERVGKGTFLDQGVAAATRAWLVGELIQRPR